MRNIVSTLVIALLIGGTAYAAPNYIETWDFEDGVAGAPHLDWMGGTVQTNGPFSGAAYPSGKRLYTGDNTAAWHVLPQATNSFIYTVNIWTDAGHINGLSNSGIGTRYTDGNENWFQGKHSSSWPVEMQFGDNTLPNPRPGTPDDWSNYQWQGGSGRTVSASNGGWILSPTDWGNPPAQMEVELMMKYNTPDNPGTIEIFARTVNYDNVRATAGTWMQLGFSGTEGFYDDWILGNDPNTGAPREINMIKLGGSTAWSQSSFDNVTFESVPEPTALSLMGLGALALIRRRRHA